jgi:hypothetical protein
MPVPGRYRKESISFRVLRRELKVLRKSLLPIRPDPTGVYSDAVYTRTRSYRVLAHAEFEYYFEERAKEICRWAVSDWPQSGRASRVVASLLSYYGEPIGSPARGARADWINEIKIGVKLGIASGRFHGDIRNNHGIREENILKMLLPIGVVIDDFDPAWLATIEAFGINRGSVAHQSASVHRLTNIPDPFTELQTVADILGGIQDLDALLNSLKRRR